VPLGVFGCFLGVFGRFWVSLGDLGDFWVISGDFGQSRVILGVFWGFLGVYWDFFVCVSDVFFVTRYISIHLAHSFCYYKIFSDVRWGLGVGFRAGEGHF
jgi:hypothetical protein